MLYDLLEDLIYFIISLFKKKNKNNPRTITKKKYIKKDIMTFNEKKFYSLLKEILGDDYIVWPQINLNSVIQKFENDKYRNELCSRNVDFGIFSKNDYKLLLLVELNDETHNTSNKRKNRDRNVYDLCKSAGIEIISFWENKPNEREYVKSRINSYINPSKEEEKVTID